MRTETIKRAVRDLGGATSLSRKIAISAQAVCNWAAEGKIPWRHRDALEAMARAHYGSEFDVGEFRTLFEPAHSIQPDHVPHAPPSPKMSGEHTKVA